LTKIRACPILRLSWQKARSTMMTEITIDFPALQEIAVKGVRRTAVFLGFGMNAAANPNLRD